MTGLQVRDLVTGYGKVEILHGVSLDAAAGEVTCVFGPNGSGKSTLIKAIAGLNRVWAGTVRLGEVRLDTLPAHHIPRHGVCLVPQGGGVFPQLTVLENLRLGGYLLPPRVVEERVTALLDAYPELARRRTAPAGKLSGGEQMLLALARALVAEPRFLLLDEPSAGLSPRRVAETFERIAALTARGVGILMVEQNIREAMRITNRLAILVGGRTRITGTPADVADERQLMALYLGG